MQPYRYADTFRRERTTGPDRLRIGAADVHSSWLYKLAMAMEPPFHLLFVLHTSLCDHALGRYESPQLSWDLLNAFFAEHSEFLEADCRFDLWIHSTASRATLVWDRHNVIYAYGPLDEFRRILLHEGLTEGTVDTPSPHVHRYWSQWNDSERRILAHFEWIYSPLDESERQLAGDK